MNLKQTASESDWKKASDILHSVVHRLQSIGRPLWATSQVSVEGLKKSYDLSERHFIVENGQSIGVVFLQTSDPKFWPEVSDHKSQFFHKLAIHPIYSGNKKGNAAIQLIIDYATKNGFEWVRLDCEIRKELFTFQFFNFSFVSIHTPA